MVTASTQSGPRHRKTLPVLAGADIDLFPGEVVGLVGENGSGKSTLMKILVGALAADGGEIMRRGQLGYCPQEPVLYSRLTCDEHFELFGRAYGIPDAAAARSRGAIYDSLGFQRYARTRADQPGTKAAGRSVLIISHFVVDEDRFDRILDIRDGRTWPR